MKFDRNFVYGLEGHKLMQLACVSDILKRTDEHDLAKYIDEVLTEASPVFALTPEEMAA